MCLLRHPDDFGGLRKPPPSGMRSSNLPSLVVQANIVSHGWATTGSGVTQCLTPASPQLGYAASVSCNDVCGWMSEQPFRGVLQNLSAWPWNLDEPGRRQAFDKHAADTMPAKSWLKQYSRIYEIGNSRARKMKGPKACLMRSKLKRILAREAMEDMTSR